MREETIVNLHLRDRNIKEPLKRSKASKPATFGEATYDDFQNGKARIWSWNINGMKNAQEKGTLLAFFEQTDYPDIILINETRTDIETITAKKYYKEVPDGYEQHWFCSTGKKGYSGVAIFSKVKPLQVLYGL